VQQKNIMFSESSYKEILNFINQSNKTTKIVAVSKNHPIESVIKALEFGIRIFGENRVQEAINKFSSVKKNFPEIELHLTGPLQTNKVKLALSIFDIIQTLDREKLAIELSKYTEIIKNKFFFIQINTGKEKNKSGIYPELADDFINYCKDDLGISVVGLMCIPPVGENPIIHFKMIKKIAEKNYIKGLSMGMSGDYKEGVLSGATHIRVGTKLFGQRS
jgi:pyridoxal phosphate enzyme (YggS family)